MVAVPTASNAPPKNVTGPPGDKNSDGEDWWLLLFLALLVNPLPPDVGIPGGYTPTPIPPPDWAGTWSNPQPSSTTTTTTTTTSDENEPTCAASIPGLTYDWSDDSENSDWADQGTDPTYTKRKRGVIPKLVKRQDPRCEPKLILG